MRHLAEQIYRRKDHPERREEHLLFVESIHRPKAPFFGRSRKLVVHAQSAYIVHQDFDVTHLVSRVGLTWQRGHRDPVPQTTITQPASRFRVVGLRVIDEFLGAAHRRMRGAEQSLEIVEKISGHHRRDVEERRHLRVEIPILLHFLIIRTTKVALFQSQST